MNRLLEVENVIATSHLVGIRSAQRMKKLTNTVRRLLHQILFVSGSILANDLEDLTGTQLPLNDCLLKPETDTTRRTSG